MVRLQPDYIVFTSDHGEGAATQIADLRSRPAWKGLDAVEMGHVVDVSEEAVRPSPGLVDAIEQLARELHPEAFALNSGGRDLVGGARVQWEMVASACTKKECVSCAL